jgi:hypothetical protein
MRAPAAPLSTAVAILQTVKGRSFDSLAEASAYLKLLSPEERVEVVTDQAASLVAVHARVDKCMEYLEGFVEEDEAFVNRMARDPEIWREISRGAGRARTSEKKKRQAWSRCCSRWGEEAVQRHFGHLLDAGEHTWSKARRLAMREGDVSRAVGRIRDAMFWRLAHCRPGRSADLYPVAVDFDKAKDDDLPAVDAAAIAAAGYTVDENGWLTLAAASQRRSIREVGDPGGDLTSSAKLSRSSRSSSPLSSAPSDLDGDGHLGDLKDLNHRPGARLSLGNLADSASPEADSSFIGSAAGDDTSIFDPWVSLSESENSDATEASDGDWAEERHPRGYGATAVRRHACRCAGAVPRAFLARCSARGALRPGQQVQLVKEWVRWTRVGQGVCFQHSKAVASAVGLQTRMLNVATVKDRLRRYHRAALQSAVGDLKVGKDTYAWFRLAARPSRPSDRLGPYRLMPAVVEPFAIDRDDQARLCRYLGVDRQDWDRRGSVVADCFGWWATERYSGPRATLAATTVLEVVLEEFEMYHAHLRLINQKPNYGWLRNMYHSLGQQAMRQDPRYFAIYCALRPDQNTNLVSYPYYAKYAREGDNTFFRHIDVNIKELATAGRGANMIQGSASLDDERDDDCTMILPGMHRHVKAWDAALAARGYSTGALVHRIQDAMFTPDDEERFGTRWTPQPCRRGQVRFTLPHLPHGAYGPAKGTRRTMLPWFCGLQSDLETLEVAEGGTWSDLSAAHRDLEAARLSPSGLPNRYGAIPFAFPAAIELDGLGALSDALVCRRRHDRYAVLVEKKRLLTGTEAEVDAYLERWRRAAVNRVCETFELVREAEMERFGDRSYFYRKSRGLPLAGPDDDPDAREGVEACAHGFEEPGVEVDADAGDSEATGGQAGRQ